MKQTIEEFADLGPIKPLNVDYLAERAASDQLK